MPNNRDEQSDELEALECIFEANDFTRTASETADPVGRLVVRMQLPQPVVFHVPSVEGVACSVTIEHLPPVTILFALPPAYPSEAPPHFTLACDWLPLAHRRILLLKLKELCSQLLGSVVLFSMAQFVQDDAIAALNLLNGHTLHIEYDSPKETLAAVDKLVAADRDHREHLFANSTLTCGICMDSKLGNSCFQFDCKHAYCKPCLTDYFTIHITEGNALQVTCPNAACKRPPQLASGATSSITPLPPSTLSRIVPQSLVARYTTLLDLHNLLKQPNVTYCPRPTCNAPTLKDPEEEKLCICPECSYAFCFFCNRTWHGYASYCQIRHLETIAKEYTSASQEQRKTLELKYGKKVLEKVVREIEEDRLNKQWFADNAQACPNCTCMVERAEGCCHMTCKVCDEHFCYVCGERLNRSNPYHHFNTPGEPCFGRLFEGTVPGEYDPLNDPAVMGGVEEVREEEVWDERGIVVEPAGMDETEFEALRRRIDAGI
ncbi:E3 ubiquitin-protein ligase rnf14 [Podochytrium sp. JEL0797]|nr:E3 ubiquitin-protein ligase rnf14 [Podochytrium sp. JEL0797]